MLIAEKRSKKTEKIVLALKETAAELNVKKTKKKKNKRWQAFRFLHLFNAKTHFRQLANWEALRISHTHTHTFAYSCLWHNCG